MFTLHTYEKYISNYVPKARLIRIESKRCQWNPKTNQLDFKNLTNYAMSFNESGRLMHVYVPKGSWDKGKINKTIYLYNKQNRPSTLLTYNVKSQVLSCTINLYYDSRSRTVQEISNYSESYFGLNYIHEYERDSHVVNCYDNEDVIEFIIKEKLNSKGNVTEHKVFVKGEDLTFFEKYIYTDDGKLLFTFLLNEENEVCSETRYSGNFKTTIDRKDSNSVSVEETQTQYNDKGHWVKKCIIRNGSLKWIEERSIKYYD